jgi:uncharacterized protein
MKIFYNREERRLRAVVRILLQLLVFVLGLSLVSFFSIVLLAAWMMVTGTLHISQGMEMQEMIAAINQAVVQQPLLFSVRWLSMIILFVLLYAFIARVIDRRSIKDYGLKINRVWLRDLGFGLLLGAVLMALMFGIEYLLGWVIVTDTFLTLGSADGLFWAMLLGALMHYVWVGVNEELFSRGYQLRNIAEGLNLPRIGKRNALLISYIITSSVFGLLHMGNPNATWMSGLNLILAGLMLGVGMVMTGSLAIPIGLHITWNFFQGNVFGLPVSGTYSGHSLISVIQSGPELWTGGAFGPEGGLLGVLIMLLGIALTWLYIRITRGSAGLHTGLAQYHPRRAPEHEDASVSPVSLERLA